MKLTPKLSFLIKIIHYLQGPLLAEDSSCAQGVSLEAEAVYF